MEGYIDALELTVIAIATLLFISLCFTALVYCIRKSTEAGRKVRGQRSLSRDK